MRALTLLPLLIVGGVILTTVKRSSLPRGIRNNNPGNIRLTKIQWQGMQSAQNDADFVQFIDPVYGFRAMTRILRNYQRRGLVTLRDMISTYAPKNENDTNAYVNFVAKRINVAPDAPLDLGLHLFPLLKAISEFENGSRFADFYNDSTIQEGIALA